MNVNRDPELLIKAFLDDGLDELPDRSYDGVRSAIEQTRQRVVFGPWREPQMMKIAKIAFAAAAIVLVAVLGLRFLPTISGPGGATANPSPLSTPVPTPTQVPTPAPTPAASPIADPSGRLQPGTYVAHPFDTLLGMDARAFTFQVPSANWEALQEVPGNTEGVAWNDGNGDSDGVGLGFVKLHSMNTDACHWTTDDDIAIGPTVDDLLEALANSTNFDAGVPYPESVANITGQGVELTMPATLAQPTVGCDEEAYRTWNAYGFDIYAQGPSNIWRLGIFAVGDQPYIVLASYMPDTPDAVLNEMMSIFRSVSIDSSPGCPQYSHNCN